MALKDMLGAGESLFKNPIALDFDFQPKLIPFREKEQKTIAMCIRPLFADRSGRNLLLFGPPGVGKTVATRHVLEEVEEQTDDIKPLYINCWHKNTAHKMLLDLCDQIGYAFTQNKNTEELFDIVKKTLNKKAAVFVLDEIDKLHETDILYDLIEEIYKKSIIMITNHKDWISQLDERIRSRITAEIVEFNPYTEAETREIMKQRISYALVQGVLDNDAFLAIAKKTALLKDIRSGLYLIKEAASIAEDRASKKITLAHAQEAIAKLDAFKIKKTEDLDPDSRKILELVKENSGAKIGDVFKKYSTNGGNQVYKSFQRKVQRLSEGKYIITERIPGGMGGQTTILKYTEN